MSFYIALGAFIIFIVIYATMASAIIYHLNAFSLPSWSGRRISIIIFSVLSFLFIGLAIIFFFQVPWTTYALTPQ